MTNPTPPRLGLGIGWRPELALLIERRRDLGFIELLAEDFTDAPLPLPIEQLRDRGVAVIPHGVTLSLGSAEPPDPRRLDALAQLAQRVQAPLVSEHIAFVRGGGLETGHLLPLPRSREMIDLLVENIQQAQSALPVPLALENIASLLEWPNPEMYEASFLAEIIERTGVLLLLDIENVYANARNHGDDPVAYLDRLPLNKLAYVHVAGGIEKGGLYHDTHTSPIPAGVFDLLRELRLRTPIPGVMLERDDCFPADALIHAELDALAAALTAN